MIHEIPVLGAPLSGKSTFLGAAAYAAGTAPSVREEVLRTDGPFNGARIRLFEAIIHSPVEARLWCIPGGCDADWPIQFAREPSAALFVADAQGSMHGRNLEFWKPVQHLVPIDGWFVVLTKCDLAKEVDRSEALPQPLRDRPVFRVAGDHGDNEALAALSFLRETALRFVARRG